MTIIEYMIKVPYGYFIAFEKPYGNEMGFFIEPKFTFKIDSQFLKNYSLYHVTSKDKIPKIMRVGLLPKDTQTTYHHDGTRIFLMCVKGDIGVVRALKKTLSSNKGKLVEDMEIIKITPSKHMDLYIDPNFKDSEKYASVSTFQNIPPTDIQITLDNH